MADDSGCGRLWNDSADYAKEISFENRFLDYDAHFSDPEEFVDKVSDDGLLHIW